MLVNLIGAAMLLPLAACEKGREAKPKEYAFDVLVSNFLDRPINHILVNGQYIGIAGGFGMSGVVEGVPIATGPQAITWQLDGPRGRPGNGDAVAMKNVLIVKESDIPKDAVYLGIYIYPDYTVEYQFSEHLPRNTERGATILKTRGDGQNQP